MQTFMPYSNYAACAKHLDRQRLGKQRVETKQILLALGVDVGEHKGRPTSGWRNHPAVKMWAGHERQLASYGFAVCDEWQKRGYKDTLGDQFVDIFFNRIDLGVHSPKWLGDPEFHRSHRRALLVKDPKFYSEIAPQWVEEFGGVPDSYEYVWPE